MRRPTVVSQSGRLTETMVGMLLEIRRRTVCRRTAAPPLTCHATAAGTNVYRDRLAVPSAQCRVSCTSSFACSTSRRRLTESREMSSRLTGA
eukprot:4788585-Prymnesium_polylepis.1